MVKRIKVRKEQKPKRKIRTKTVSEILQESENVNKLKDDLQDTDDVIADAISDIISRTRADETIVGSEERPELRELSSEEFIRAFRQKAGE